jgi:hypothetical protein
MKARELRCYLLVHQLPPTPPYLRAKIRRRLARAGAVALKRSVYALPRSREALQEFRSIAEEAIAGGGDAFVCDAAFVDPKVRARVFDRFGGRRPDSYVGRTWVTRHGLHVDRIASAWLVRRFVDERARFRFIDPGREGPRLGELRFDMAGGDFTHEGDRCTFETLLSRMALKDSALRAVGEIVHDIDLKDGKFGRPEAIGVEQLVLGIILGSPEDEGRLERGIGLFDNLYHSFARRRESRPKSLLKGGGRS